MAPGTEIGPPRPATLRRDPLFGLKLLAAKSIGRLSRLTGRGGGTTLPGRTLLRLAPDAIERLGSGLTGGTALISATNGKTTTAGMIAAALRADGRDLVHNRAGSNMAWGVATALLDSKGRGKSVGKSGREGLFEVDEAWLPEVTRALDPELIILCNLFRDQLDRYGELERLADEWSALIASRQAPGRKLVLNADDPLVADLGRDRDLKRLDGVTFFGIEDPSQALPALQHAHDAKHCRRCGATYSYERAFVGHLGHYDCPACDAGRPAPDLAATAIELRGMDGSSFTVSDSREQDAEHRFELPLPGLYNVYNALAAIASARALGVGWDQIRTAIGSIEAVFGRVEMLEVDGQDLGILLIKNPAGTNEVLRTLSQEAERSSGDQGIDLWIALNDNIADGRDVSWVWDADFELLEGGVRRVTCAGTRAAEIALRLKYAGIPSDSIEVVGEIGTSLDRALERAEGGRVFALPTYTALIELRTMLARRGVAEDYWR